MSDRQIGVRVISEETGRRHSGNDRDVVVVVPDRSPSGLRVRVRPSHAAASSPAEPAAAPTAPARSPTPAVSAPTAPPTVFLDG